MAVIQRGILGGFKNKIGNVVGGSWKGIATMRTLPLSVANPQTAGQVAQRTKFSAVVEIAKFLLVGTIKPLWDRFAQRMSGYNMFVSVNIPFFSDAGVLTYPSLVISQGSLTGVVNLATTADASANSIAPTWDDNSGSGTALATDEAYFVAYNETQEVWEQWPAEDVRNSASAALTPQNALVAGDTIHLYMAFRRVDGTLVSNTAYATTVVVA